MAAPVSAAAADGRLPDGSCDDRQLRGIFARTRTIAVVGASARWNRPSYFAMKYLQDKGFRVIPVNPRRAGAEILGETVRAALAEVPGRVDMVDIFRAAEEADAIVDDAIAIGAGTVWMQLGIRNDRAAARAEAAGLTVVMNRCPKIEYARLHGELSWHGFNSGVITSRKRRIRHR